MTDDDFQSEPCLLTLHVPGGTPETTRGTRALPRTRRSRLFGVFHEEQLK